MATYLALGNFTNKGISSIKETTKRADAVKEMASEFGVRMSDIYWTLGQYDLVTLWEAPDDASMTAFGLAIAAAGNVRMQTMKAFSKNEMNEIIGKMG